MDRTMSQNKMLEELKCQKTFYMSFAAVKRLMDLAEKHETSVNEMANRVIEAGLTIEETR